MASVIVKRPAITDMANWIELIPSTVFFNRRHNFSTLLRELSMKLNLRRPWAWLFLVSDWLDRRHEVWVPC